MTQYEYIDLAASYHDIAISTLMGYFTVLSAYFIAAYTVGAALTRNQTIAVTGLFLVMEMFLIWGTVNYFRVGREYRVLAGEEVVSIPPHHLALVLLGIGVLSGLKFMWDIRHPKTE